MFNGQVSSFGRYAYNTGLGVVSGLIAGGNGAQDTYKYFSRGGYSVVRDWPRSLMHPISDYSRAAIKAAVKSTLSDGAGDAIYSYATVANNNDNTSSVVSSASTSSERFNRYRIPKEYTVSKLRNIAMAM